MSKQSEAKEFQGYNANPVPATCPNCANYASHMVEKTYDGYLGKQVWTEEKDKRCLIGNFAVKKTATCNLFAVKRK